MSIDHILKRENVLMENELCMCCNKFFMAVAFDNYFLFLSYVENKYGIGSKNKYESSHFENETWYRCYNDRIHCKLCGKQICCLCNELYYIKKNKKICRCSVNSYIT